MGVTLSPPVTIKILELLGEGIPPNPWRSGKCWEEGGDRVTGVTGPEDAREKGQGLSKFQSDVVQKAVE